MPWNNSCLICFFYFSNWRILHYLLTCLASLAVTAEGVGFQGSIWVRNRVFKARNLNNKPVESLSWGRKFRESHFNHYYSSFNHLLVMTGSHSLRCKASMCLFGGETVSKCQDQHRAHVTGWDAFGKDWIRSASPLLCTCSIRTLCQTFIVLLSVGH